MKKPWPKQKQPESSRVPYQQSEVFRFGNTVVDDWEGQLNAWPLDEGLIDYVDNSYASEMGNIGATINIIANATISLGDNTIDASSITPELLASLNELGGSEANVATGYHAIEFLLWGQDLNGTKAGAGSRSYTDYVQGKGCTNGNCDRRAAYLKAAAELLVSDLADMEAQWQPGGEYRKQLLAKDTKEILTIALYGMGSLSLGELAGERMKVALEANSPEDEHDCFSDNTHYSHYYDALGVRNIYAGEYKRVDGSVKGPSIGNLVAKKDARLHKSMQAAFQKTDKKMMALVNSAESGEAAFDQMIAEHNTKGHKIVSEAIAALVAQTQLIEKVALTLGIENLNPDTADHEF
ncbi:MAG: imelysin family protein [Porticoccaceae bacterium]